MHAYAVWIKDRADRYMHAYIRTVTHPRMHAHIHTHTLLSLSRSLSRSLSLCLSHSHMRNRTIWNRSACAMPRIIDGTTLETVGTTLETVGTTLETVGTTLETVPYLLIGTTLETVPYLLIQSRDINISPLILFQSRVLV